MRRLAPLGVLGACGLLLGCAVEQVHGTAAPAEAPLSASPSASPSASASAGAAPTEPTPTSTYVPVLGDGPHHVGMDIQPGRYATGPSVRDCYWERTDVMGNVAQNAHVAYSAEGVTVTILPSDDDFFSQGCGPWHRVQ